MNYRDWIDYNHTNRIKEDSSVPDEAFVQQLWFEELYCNPLITKGGGQIQILQPGFWNHAAGPDFYQAALVNERGELETGSVEIDLQEGLWQQHRHASNPQYHDVILQVVWQTGEKKFQPATADNRAVRQVALASQLRFPLQELRQHFVSGKVERDVGTRPGRCQAELAQHADATVLNILHAAGEFRFAQKCQLWNLRAAALGEEQALWVGLAEALGYTRNRAGFRGLAQRIPIQKLLAIEDDLQREALLFGVAGFIPHQQLPERLAAFVYIRELWSAWWQLRSAWQERVIPQRIWQLSGVRPLNRPERRIALMAILSSRIHWRQFSRLAKVGNQDLLWDFIADLEHDFWSRHCTLASSRQASTAVLLGAERLTALMFNTLWPLALQQDADGVKDMLRQATAAGQPNHLVQIAALRLLHKRPTVNWQQSLLAREGLLQIYRDFCSQDSCHCRDCAFPEILKKYL